MQQEQTIEQIAAAAVEEIPIVETQAETAKEVKKQVRAQTKQTAAKSSSKKTSAKPSSKKTSAKPAAVETDKIIMSVSNPPRPDVRHIENGDLLIPVE